MHAGITVIETVVRKAVVELDDEEFGWHLDHVAGLHAKARVWREQHPGEEYRGWGDDVPAPKPEPQDYASARPVVLRQEAMDVYGRWPDVVATYVLGKQFGEPVELGGEQPATCADCGQPITTQDWLLVRPDEVDPDMVDMPDAAHWHPEREVED